ncbi:ammonium transporter [Neptunomonas antarctica]|uniref:Ammonium transporter, Amt family n=1 Tax=Neptunomonas antarctica TaxID=619304 RepID=A0A1N7NGE4_9GAMM|nr:ammonium transporter [Neptunomonas antarctica]SIS97386.1 ammonium transporter, Amt family [Neptunomonas antarctica]
MEHNIWLLFSTVLVFFMQAGFLCLETGRTRSKNSINVAAKNIADFLLSAALFWLVGFGLMFGSDYWGIVGFSDFFFGETQSANQICFFLFQTMFCGTAATLASGAVAERMTFNGYLCITVILSLLIYPITGHWAWASAYGGQQGWLQAAGFVDFAGSTVVHSVGGWVALAAVIIIGPRIGRFKGGRLPQGSNLPMSALGTLLIWIGWFGFNGGSTLLLNEQVPLILLNTTVAAVFGGLCAVCFYYLKHGYFDVAEMLNGIIGGLVGITASCYAVSPVEAAVIGGISGGVVFYGSRLMADLGLDDAIGVVPAHLLAGIWGTLAVAVFGDAEILATGLSFWQQLGVQLLGITSIGAYSFILSYLLIRILNNFVPLRVSAADEERGLNVSEHNANTELVGLLSSMHQQQIEGDFTLPVPEEPFTEVGQIAKSYNQVISRVQLEISERDSAINQFQASEKRKSAILDSSMDCIVSVDKHGNIIEFNPAAERTFGCLKSHVQGRNFFLMFLMVKDQKQAIDSLQQMFTLSQGLLLNRRNTMQLQRSSEHVFPAEITITTTPLNNGISIEYTLHIRDVTRQNKLQARLKFLAYRDPLTSLYNRTFLMEQLLEALTKAEQHGLSVALLFLDLDKFKKINDSLGHKAGDELLCEVARRLNRVCRETDVVARWGGDEFIVLMRGKIDPKLAADRAENILQVMRQSVEIQGKKFTIPTSIGVTLSVGSEFSADKMIQHADIAMYCAKQNGRDNYQIFEPAMAQLVSKNIIYENEMRQNLDSPQFYLVYQPKVCLHKSNVVGFEALLRWAHPVEGLISPSDFIPIAEESNLIIEVGEKVINDCLAQLYEWRKQGLNIVPISVNLSGKHLMSNELIPFINKQLSYYGIEGHYLEIEITEGVLVHDIERCIEVMAEIKSLNIKISVDDFGTGYSSLSYLKRLPVDILKIDQSFVQECDATEEDRQICATIINLAQNLDLSIVAEGVERQTQLDVLKSMHCEVFQGYYFYKPMPVEKVTALLSLLCQPTPQEDVAALVSNDVRV